jgi:hypothetical protein
MRNLETRQYSLKAWKCSLNTPSYSNHRLQGPSMHINTNQFKSYISVVTQLEDAAVSRGAWVERKARGQGLVGRKQDGPDGVASNTDPRADALSNALMSAFRFDRRGIILIARPNHLFTPTTCTQEPPSHKSTCIQTERTSNENGLS